MRARFGSSSYACDAQVVSISRWLNIGHVAQVDQAVVRLARRHDAVSEVPVRRENFADQ